MEIFLSGAPRAPARASVAKPSGTPPKPIRLSILWSLGYCGGRAPCGVHRGLLAISVGPKPLAKADHPSASARGILAKASGAEKLVNQYE